jgi:prolyl 4-hydroxylase
MIDGGESWCGTIWRYTRMFIDHFDWQVPMYGVVERVLDDNKCAGLIARVAGGDWLAATVNGPDGRYRNERIRNNELALVNDETLAQELYARLQPVLPAKMFGQSFCGIHPSLRVYRYQPGQYFSPHSDQPYFDAHGRQSRLTLIVYLDQQCQGGETAFLELQNPHGERGVVVEPVQGRLLWFQHALLHEGKRVEQGVKHVLRTDAIYG